MTERYTSEGLMSVDPTITSQGMDPTTVNGTDESLVQTCYETLIPDFLIIIIGLVGLPGNAVVIYLLGCRMRRNTISVYILNLAASDFLVLCCHCFGSLLIVIRPFHHLYIGISFILINIALIPYIAGLSTLSAISMERCLSVLWPIWYRCHRPRHTSAIVCTLLWALSLLLNILEWNYSGFLYEFFSSIWWKNFDFIVTAWLIFLFLTLSGSSLTLVVRILCGSRRMPVTRLYVTILFTVLVFLICALPFGLFWFLLLWLPITLPDFSCYFYIATTVLSCVNSCANPIIYFFIGSFRQQHQTLKLVLQRALQDSYHENEGEDRHVQETLEMSGSGVA
ncbi:Mas-related G-protein coupled receptor member X1 [Heterocephalus glaber]|uniref:Mas-related G-protein coupled receptor member X1 n=1 Tax=Heterocephalus glaber TaxID=10181 RepID=G5AR17_HETGA|nr:Mas-related G-protein coupled receptor member X1 [Heterocephalus glaber]